MDMLLVVDNGPTGGAPVIGALRTDRRGRFKIRITQREGCARCETGIIGVCPLIDIDSVRPEATGSVNPGPGFRHGFTHVCEESGVGIREFEAGGRRACVDWGWPRIRATMRHRAARVMATAARQGFSGPDVQPVLVTGANPSSFIVQHADGKRDVGGHCHPNRPIRLDRHVAENFPHRLRLAAPKCGVVEVPDLFIGN